MAKHGGARRGAGVKKGSHIKVSKKLSERKVVTALQKGITPFDVMMRTIRYLDREMNKLEAEIRTKIPDWDTAPQLMYEREGPVGAFFDAMDKILDVSIDAAPYVHPHVRSIDAPAGGGLKDLSNLTDKEVDDLERITRKLAGSYGGSGGERAP